MNIVSVNYGVQKRTPFIFNVKLVDIMSPINFYIIFWLVK